MGRMPDGDSAEASDGRCLAYGCPARYKGGGDVRMSVTESTLEFEDGWESIGLSWWSRHSSWILGVHPVLSF